MNTLYHIISNIILGGILYLFEIITTLEIYLIFISFSFLIDIDHVIYFVLKNNFSIKKIKKDAIKHRKSMKPGIYPLHSPEITIIILILSFFSQIIALIFISNLLHLSLDFYEHTRHHKNTKWFKEWSMIYQLKS